MAEEKVKAISGDNPVTGFYVFIGLMTAVLVFVAIYLLISYF
ncbi:MAG: hypothetical protein V1799_16090 [bacterium]